MFTKALLLTAFSLTLLSLPAHGEEPVDVSREPAASSAISSDDARILRRGEITKGRYITGGVVGSVVGFGIGHAIQGRYPEIGWAFTAGESASVAVLFVAALSCFGDREPSADGSLPACQPPAVLYGVGLAGLLGFHIWEVIDLWIRPPQLNARYRELTHQRRAWEDLKIYPTLVDRSPALGLGFTF